MDFPRDERLNFGGFLKSVIFHIVTTEHPAFVSQKHVPIENVAHFRDGVSVLYFVYKLLVLGREKTDQATLSAYDQKVVLHRRGRDDRFPLQIVDERCQVITRLFFILLGGAGGALLVDIDLARRCTTDYTICL